MPQRLVNIQNAQAQSVEALQLPQSEDTYEHVTTQSSEDRDKVGTQELEQPGIDVPHVEQKQVYEEDEFPNAQNLQTPPSESVMEQRDDTFTNLEVAEHRQLSFVE